MYAQKILGDRKVIEFEVITIQGPQATAVRVGTPDGDQLTAKIHPEHGMFIIRTIEDHEVVDAFPLVNLISFRPSVFGEVDEVTPR